MHVTMHGRLSSNTRLYSKIHGNVEASHCDPICRNAWAHNSPFLETTTPTPKLISYTSTHIFSSNIVTSASVNSNLLCHFLIFLSFCFSFFRFASPCFNPSTSIHRHTRQKPPPNNPELCFSDEATYASCCVPWLSWCPP